MNMVRLSESLICIILSSLNCDISPDEKVFSKPLGLPMAYALSPTLGFLVDNGRYLNDVFPASIVNIIISFVLSFNITSLSLY